MKKKLTFAERAEKIIESLDQLYVDLDDAEDAAYTEFAQDHALYFFRDLAVWAGKFGALT